MDLKVMTKEQLEEILAQLKKGKAQLEAEKKSNKNWTPEMQEELQECVSTIVDVEEQITVLVEAAKKEVAAAKLAEGYKPLVGEENLVVAELVQGKRFDPNTGEEISKKFTQKFSEGEWRVFERSASQLGYTFTVIYNPLKK